MALADVRPLRVAAVVQADDPPNNAPAFPARGAARAPPARGAWRGVEARNARQPDNANGRQPPWRD